MLRVVGSLMIALAWWCSLAGTPASAASKVADSPTLAGIYSRSANKTVWMPERGGSRVSSKVVAQAAITGPVAFRRLTALPTGDPYLAATPDLQLSPTIRSRARQLQNDPLRIYAHVLGSFLFEPYYYGSLKGADETLLQRSGNDTDLSSLLIALLRASGFQARYAQGTIVVPIRDAMRWLGVVATTVPADIFASAGYPVTPVIQGGRTVALEVRHTWVEAFVPVNGVRRWVSMNPSLKEQLRSTGVDINGIADTSLLDVLQRISNSADLDPATSAVKSLDSETVERRLPYRARRLQNYFEGESEALTYGEVIGSPRILPSAAATLTSSRTFTVKGVVRRYAELPGDQRHYVRIRETYSSIDETLAIPEIITQRLTMSATPANASDQALFGRMGGLLNATSLTPVIPELRLGGRLLVKGTASRAVAVPGNLIVDLLEGGRSVFSRQHQSYRYGGFYAIVLDTQRSSGSKIARSASRLAVALRASGDNPITEAVAGELMHSLGLVYFSLLNRSTAELAGTSNAIAFHPVSEGLFGLPAAQGTPTRPLGVRLGASIDVGRYDLAVFPRNGSQAFVGQDFRMAALFAASELEATVIRLYLGLPAESTTTCLRESIDRAVPVFGMSIRNLQSVQPQLDRSITNNFGYVQVAQALGAGAVVVLHQRRLKQHDGSFACFVVSNASTEEVSFLIQNGTLGAELAAWLGASPEQIRALRDAIENVVRLAEGCGLGDVVNVEGQSYELTYAVGSFLCGFSPLADLRDISANGTRFLVSGSEEDRNALLIALLATIPLLGDAAKATLNPTLAKAFLRDVFKAARACNAAPGGRACVLLTEFAAKGGADALSRVKVALNLGDDVAPEVARFGGGDALKVTGKAIPNDPNSADVTYLMVKSGQSLESKLRARLPGFDPMKLNLWGDGAVAEALADIHYVDDLGYTAVHRGIKPNGQGLDLIYKDRSGNYVLVEVKGKLGSGGLNQANLNYKDLNPQMSNGWIDRTYNTVDPDGSDAIQRAVSYGKLSADDAAALRAATATGLTNGRVRKEVVVPRRGVSGGEVDPRILSDPDWRHAEDANGISHFVFIDVDGLPGT